MGDEPVKSHEYVGPDDNDNTPFWYLIGIRWTQPCPHCHKDIVRFEVTHAQLAAALVVLLVAIAISVVVRW